MKIAKIGIEQSNKNTSTSFKGALNNRCLKRGLEFAANNGVLFSGAACVLLSTVFRPVAILMTPKAKKEDKQYACVRSITSGVLGFGIMAAISVPVVNAVHNVAKNPQKYMSEVAIKAFKAGEKSLEKSKNFQFASQMVKLSSAFLTALPKAFLACALIPPLMSFLFNPKQNLKPKEDNFVKISNSKVSFKGRFNETLSKGVGKFFNWKPLQKFSDKFKDTNLAQHLFSLNDIFLTGLFIKYTSDNKKIKEDRKKTLNWNAALTTGLTIPVSYGVSKLLDKPTANFIEKFSNANKSDKKLYKYIEGIKIAKPALIMGSLYYIAAPVISTLLADTISGNKNTKE